MLRWLKNIKYFIYIKKSGQFSNEWYLGNNPADIEKYCDRVIQLDHGKVVEDKS